MWSSKILFGSYIGLIRLAVIGILLYPTLVLLLRVTGKRTLAKMNAFDLVVTVALGSTLASALTSPEVTYLQGVAALAMLVLLQLAVTWLSVRVPLFARLVKSEPRLLFHKGRMLEAAMRSQRVVEAEVLQAIRSAGHSSLEGVEAVVLETDGTFTVLSKTTAGPDSTLRGVNGVDIE